MRLFVSYAREDSRWFQEKPDTYNLIPWLQTALQRDEVEIWHDEGDLWGGDPWLAKIKEAIDGSQIALLLLSEAFFSSDVIQRTELPRIMDRFGRGEMEVIPVLLEDCEWKEFKAVAALQLVPSHATPLVGYTLEYAMWTTGRQEVLDAIRQRVRQMTKHRDSGSPAPPPGPADPLTSPSPLGKPPPPPWPRPVVWGSALVVLSLVAVLLATRPWRHDQIAAIATPGQTATITTEPTPPASTATSLFIAPSLTPALASETLASEDVVATSAVSTPLSHTATPSPILPTQTTLPSSSTPLPPTPATGGVEVAVEPSHEYSCIRLTTGLGKTTEADYRGLATDDDVLDYLISEQEQRLGAAHFIVQQAEGLHMIMPLTAFREAHTVEGTTQAITLNDGRQVEGQLAFTIGEEDQAQYDLRTAREVALLGLSAQDAEVETPTDAQADQWQLELLAPVVATYTVSSPRFAFHWDHRSAGGTYSDRQTTTQSFYLEVGGDQYLANLADLDEIEFTGDETIVRIGSVETTGRLVLTTLEGKQGSMGRLVLDLVGENTTLVLRYPTFLFTSPMAILRRIPTA
jgi:hypothetical protein